jgi:hypothetical protein
MSEQQRSVREMTEEEMRAEIIAAKHRLSLMHSHLTEEERAELALLMRLPPRSLH